MSPWATIMLMCVRKGYRSRDIEHFCGYRIKISFIYTSMIGRQTKNIFLCERAAQSSALLPLCDGVETRHLCAIVYLPPDPFVALVSRPPFPCGSRSKSPLMGECGHLTIHASPGIFSRGPIHASRVMFREATVSVPRSLRLPATSLPSAPSLGSHTLIRSASSFSETGKVTGLFSCACTQG